MDIVINVPIWMEYGRRELAKIMGHLTKMIIFLMKATIIIFQELTVGSDAVTAEGTKTCAFVTDYHDAHPKSRYVMRHEVSKRMR